MGRVLWRDVGFVGFVFPRGTLAGVAVEVAEALVCQCGDWHFLPLVKMCRHSLYMVGPPVCFFKFFFLLVVTELYMVCFTRSGWTHPFTGSGQALPSRRTREDRMGH